MAAATWKKLVVSGSDISQLNNDAGYLTSVTAQNAFATASVNGVALIADGANGTLTFASSSDGLKITGDAGTDTITFDLTLSDLTDGNGINDFTYNGSATATISVQADSTTGGDIQPVNVTANGVGLDIQAIAGNGLSADGSANLTVNTGSTHFTNGVVSALPAGTISGSSQVNYSQISGVPSGIISGSDILNGTVQGVVSASFNGVLDTGTLFNLGTTGTPTFSSVTTTGDVAVNGGDITTTAGTFNLINTNATTINFGGAAGTISIGNGTSTTTVNDDLVVTGDLTVNGTTTTINTTNLLVEDKFALFASGSTTATDGGIIIQSAVAGTGFALGYDSTTDRWGLQDALLHTTTDIIPKDFIVTVSKSAVDPLPDPTYGGASNGEGNMHINTVTNDIWIFA